MSTIESFFSKITDQKTVRVTLPLTDQIGTERLICVYGTNDPPVFFLYFPKGDLPVNHIDVHRKCVVTADFGGQFISITANINKISNEQTLQLSAVEVVTHEQFRDYFRVDANTPVTAASIQKKYGYSQEPPLHLEGETLDISGSGCLCIFKQPLDEGKKLLINVALPTDLNEIIRLVGHVVRCKKVKKDLYHVGLHFDQITSEDRDKIIGSCFALQRRHLRMKVEVSPSH